jgi:signal transduction histidine kinase
MGLAIARAIMLVHGGQITVDSNPERGCVFRFWVPLVEKQTVASSA